MRNLSLLMFFLSFSSLVGCADNNVNPTSQLDNTKDAVYEGLIPLALGNYWVFVDSMHAETDTSKVVDYEYSDNFLWWKLNKQTFAMRDLGDNFAIRNDTVFAEEPLRGGGYIIAYVIVPPADSMSGYDYLIGGDAFGHREVTYYHDGFTVPAGTFQSYACYVENIGLGKDSLVIVPKVGAVCRVTEWISFPGAKYNRVTHYLKEFHIKMN
jgi:hypothetical protein